MNKKTEKATSNKAQPSAMRAVESVEGKAEATKKKTAKPANRKAEATKKKAVKLTKGKTDTEGRTAKPVESTARAAKKARNRAYEDKLAQLQVEVAHLQAWVKASGARIVIIFEGRDARWRPG